MEVTKNGNTATITSNGYKVLFSTKGDGNIWQEALDCIRLFAFSLDDRDDHQRDLMEYFGYSEVYGNMVAARRIAEAEGIDYKRL